MEEVEAVKQIHTMGIIHCDLKPANILYGMRLDKKYRLTIIDFGGSWIEEDPGYTEAIGNEYFSSFRQLEILSSKTHSFLTMTTFSPMNKR